MTKNDKKPDYPDRPTIVAAARAGDISMGERLTAEDRVYFELLRHYPVAQPPLQSAPMAWIRKAAALAVPKPSASTLRRLVGALTFDSWQNQPALGTRSLAAAERRLRFEADGSGLDLRAEFVHGSWQFTGRVLGDLADDLPTLRADDQDVFPDENGYYHWSSPQPPQALTLTTDRRIVELGPLTWDPNGQE